MDNLYSRKDELDVIIYGIDNIISDIEDKNYIEQLQEIKYEAQDELDEVEDKLWKYEQEAEKEMNIEFERSRL